MALPDRLMDIFKNKQASYKMVLILSLLDSIDERGLASLDQVSDRFARFYIDRRKKGLIVEKGDKEILKYNHSQIHRVKNLILKNPALRYLLWN
ncbi:hypothetical protein GCM10010965_32720 [Caldalkalibacillus thermarum]|uniref:hypothetical protein n=1 Tax=Caldalkalibacillus thermarum TaxID=296745 RepID=UPI001665DC17|nr:hypothetical protein [Caldalkalibacillus thermarum]GGK37404.1 hypothetical protein GCM10010965_32720 [Caldalkalibacillus thermarum]